MPASQLALSCTDVLLAAQTGDLVLFSGSSLLSKLIELACDSSWSHVGIVYRTADDVLLLEAVKNYDGVVDVLARQECTGVRVVRLADVLYSFHGNYMALRKVQCETVAELQVVRASLQRAIAGFIQSYHLRPYEPRWYDFIAAQYHMLMRVRQRMDAFFCTEVVAVCYMDAGILGGGAGRSAPNQYLPFDFCESSNLELQAPPGLVGRVRLGGTLFVETRHALPDALDAVHDFIVTNNTEP